jgi:hypothetical protein
MADKRSRKKKDTATRSLDDATLEKIKEETEASVANMFATLRAAQESYRPVDLAAADLQTDAGPRKSASKPLPPHAVIVSKTKFESHKPYDIVNSNSAFVDALFEEHLTADEIAPDALRSHYVQYYSAEVANGGFSQFVYNSKWDEKIITSIEEGLRAMGALKHLALFKESEALLDELGTERVLAFLSSDYWDENPERDFLNSPQDRFDAISKREDLIEWNATWLRSLPHLVVMTMKEMQQEVKRRAQAIPNRAQRIADALGKEPRYMKLIRGLCDRAGQKFSLFTAADQTYRHKGRKSIAWHFITDRGHHFMVEVGGTAIMLHADTRAPVAEMAADVE